MKYNRDVIVSRHVCERYLERFPVAVDRTLSREDQIREAGVIIKRAFSEARYVSDRTPDLVHLEKGGIIFANDEYGMKLIVREQKVVTVIPVGRDAERGRKEEGDISIGKSNLYHGPSQTHRKETIR